VATLGTLEAAIMKVLWEAPGPVVVADVVDALTPTHPVAYTTVMTVLERLRVKGRVQRTKVGRAYRYRPAVTAEDYVSGLLSEALGQSGDRSAVLVRFAGTLTDAEARALREALADSGRGSHL
jgi:predicted transcriptional regulator